METFKPDYWIQKSIVNGLIATTILWSFWTPFIIFLVVPLVNAQLKEGICEGLLSYSRGIPPQQNPFFSYTDSPAADNLIQQDPQEVWENNLTLTSLMIVTAVTVIITCLIVASTIIQRYGLHIGEIVLFNVVMALIIVIIEMGFFAGVAMQYTPFDIPKIIGELDSQSKSYFNSLMQPTPTSTPPF